MDINLQKNKKVDLLNQIDQDSGIIEQKQTPASQKEDEEISDEGDIENQSSNRKLNHLHQFETPKFNSNLFSHQHSVKKSSIKRLNEDRVDPQSIFIEIQQDQIQEEDIKEEAVSSRRIQTTKVNKNYPAIVQNQYQNLQDQKKWLNQDLKNTLINPRPLFGEAEEKSFLNSYSEISETGRYSIPNETVNQSRSHSIDFSENRQIKNIKQCKEFSNEGIYDLMQLRQIYTVKAIGNYSNQRFKHRKPYYFGDETIEDENDSPTINRPINQSKAIHRLWDLLRKSIFKKRNPSCRLGLHDLQLQEEVLCPICYNSYTDPAEISTLECGHQFCQHCFLASFTVFTQNFFSCSQFRCPEATCLKEVSARTLIQCLGQKEYENFKITLRNKEIMRLKDKKFCPAPNCDNILEVKGKKTKVQCEKCKNLICYQCQSLWHEKESCAKYQRRVYADWAMNTGSHKCPKCKTLIEKNEGCNHMTCYKCQYYFCWKCGFQVKSFVHDKNLFMLPSCNRAYVHGKLNFNAEFCRFILLLIFLPFIYLFGPMLAGSIVPLYLMCRYIKKDKTCCLCLCLISPILMPITFALGLAIGAIVGCLALAFLLLPAYIVQIYFFCRKYRWWNSNQFLLEV
eukprot:403346497